MFISLFGFLLLLARATTKVTTTLLVYYLSTKLGMDRQSNTYVKPKIKTHDFRQNICIDFVPKNTTC